MLSWVAALLLAIPLGFIAPDARSQQYPSKPVTVVVPFPPGGTLDAVVRLLSDELSKSLGQPFVVLNKTGAAGIIGTEYAAKSPPDGYTLAHGYLGTIALNPPVYRDKLPYDPEKDLIAVAGTHRAAIFLVARSDLQVRDVRELVALAKSKPAELTYGTAGIASSQHVFSEFFKAQAGVDLRPIHFRGSGPANAALLGGQIDVMFDAGHVMKYVSGGRLRALAVASERRLVQFPELPTVAESFPGFEASSWHGLFAPAGTPSAIVELLNKRINEALAAPHIRQRFESLEVAALALSPGEFSAFVRQEIGKWRKIIDTAGVRLQ